MNDETIRLILDMGASGKDVEEVSTRLRTLEKETDKAAVATEKLGSKVAGTGQSLLQGGRVIQDFAQGGLGGILNNIEGLTMALGMGPGLAGVLTVIGVAALVAGPSVKSFFQGMIDGSNQVPKSTDALTAMTEALKANKDALDELHKKQSLTNTELKEFNRLTEEGIGLEKRAKEAKKARAEEEKLGELRPAGDADAEKARAEELQAHVGGQQVEIEGIMGANLDHQIEVITKQIQSYPAVNPDDEAGLAKRKKLYDIWYKQVYRLEDIKKKQSVKSMLAGAMVGGKEADIRRSMEFLPSGSGLPGADIRAAMESVLPEGLARDDAADEEFQRGLDERSAAVKRRNANQKKRAAEKKKIDDLNAQSREGQEIAFDQMDRDRAEGIKLGREAGEAATKQRPRGIDTKGIDTGHLEMIPEGANPMEAAKIMQKNAQGAVLDSAKVMEKLIENQGQLSEQQRNIMQQLQAQRQQRRLSDPKQPFRSLQRHVVREADKVTR